MVAVAQWGDRYLADPEGPPVSFTHRDCGEHVAPVLRCGAGHEIADPRDVVAVPGPGAHPAPRSRRPTGCTPGACRE